MSHPAQWFTSEKWNSHISGNLSSVLISHHFIFLWGSPLILPSNWLSSCPYGTMYSVFVLCNAFTFYSLFVWSVITSKPKANVYLREKIKWEEPWHSLWNLKYSCITLYNYTMDCTISTSAQLLRRQHRMRTSKKSEMVTYKDTTQVARNMLVSLIWIKPWHKIWHNI